MKSPYTDRSRVWFYASEVLTEETYTKALPYLTRLSKHKLVLNCQYTLIDMRILGFIEFTNCICGETMKYRLGGYFTLKSVTKKMCQYTDPITEYTYNPTSYKSYTLTRYVRRKEEKKNLYSKLTIKT